PGVRGRGRQRTFSGPVLLAAPLSSVGVRAELRDEGTLVMRGGTEPISPAEAAAMDEDKQAVVAALGDVPVVIRVEIGEATMTARDWASLGRGDVVPLGRRVGEPVVLRAGGVPLATGELVDLDGEVAVRVLERLGTEVAS
ncbi:MAG: FliM/FliN family flagellar motor switch protein, partial [Myxococcales bacterium]|nr:FliM/FliN family flagellar motor switch protein [Myxococcales bacterium]